MIELRDAARAFLADRCRREVPRLYLDGARDDRPPFWADIAALGWFGIHLPERHGGGGGSLADLTAVVEEMGRALAPGPFLPTVLASAVIDRLGAEHQRAVLLPSLAAGDIVATVAIGSTRGRMEPEGSRRDRPAGSVRLTGAWSLVLSAGLADIVVVPVAIGDQTAWAAVDRAALEVRSRPSVDETRRVADVRADGVLVPADRVIGSPLSPDAGGEERDERSPERVVEGLAIRLLAAEAVGAAAWCVATAAEHARSREQFGRPIGQFQAVKHRCADMLCQLELARAAAWDAGRGDDPLADAAAAATAPEALLRTAEGCVQVLGGMGFTWDHDAHLYLKRALAVRSLVGTPSRWRARIVELVRRGQRRRLEAQLPPEADTHRAEVKAFVAQLRTTDKRTWREQMAEAGYLAPHWPRPWGRDASAIEQVVIDEELAAAGVRRPHLQVAAWALPTLIAHGTAEQQARWLPASLRGEVTWCQLFSEPGAGSDLASLSTRAERAPGGWRVTGQKVWTSMAATADLGLCLARTGSVDARHDGIVCLVVDMRADGVEVRPLRELTGSSLFNEVFLDGVHVPDDAVVGAVGDGWRAARTTLANERVSMATGSSFGLGEEALVELLAHQPAPDPVAADEVGRLLVEAHALAALGLRSSLRAIEGDGGVVGPESSVRKLLVAEHDQKVQEAGWALAGPDGAATDGPAASWVAGYLANRCLTIAGGTSEIQRNVIAERLLGLPKDPAPEGPAPRVSP